ncbi:MAG: major facilitator superfamily protein [Gemmatimonadetes bacterium]|nr:major facilitator superfamily protein [Gemmatimonadota bacterium]
MLPRMAISRLLGRLGLDRPDLRAWAMYDWAISGFQTIVMTAVFPIFFARVPAALLSPADATARYADLNTLYLAVVALLSPVLGAAADYLGIARRLLFGFMLLGVVATAGFALIGPGDLGLASVLFVLAMIGATTSFVFYESLLPRLAGPADVDRVSSAGYALGYIGGGILLALCLAAIQFPQAVGLGASGRGLATRLTFVATAVWWIAFAIPLYRRVPEPPRLVERDESLHENPARAAFARLGGTFRSLREFRQAFLLLAAFLIYNDGIQTIIKMATAYGAEIGIPDTAMMLAILIVQFVGVPCAFLFGALAGRIGAKPAILLGLLVYTLISIVGYQMRTAGQFFVLAAMVGLVQGGTQALSRSLFASMTPAHKSAEFFGFYSVFEKFAGVFGPLFFAISIRLTGSSRNAILSVVAFFVVGGLLLLFVKVDEGRRAAREAEVLVAAS